MTTNEPHGTIETALETLSPFERTIVSAHFFDGDPVGRITRNYNLKRADVEALIGTALTTMKTLLRSRGIKSVGDVV